MVDRLVLIIFFLSSTFALSQATENNSNIGLPENGTFSGSSFDNVQVNNGNLHIEIPLYTIPGRGLNVSAKYVYDNKGWYLFNHCTHMGVCSDSVRFKDAGWRLVKSTDYSGRVKSVVQTCDPGITAMTYSYTVVEPDGTKHHMLPDPVVDSGSPCANRWPTAATMYADDGSGWVVQVNSSSPNDIVAKNGLKITSGTNAAGDPTTTLTDANGNKVLYEGGNTNRITDTLGRSIPTDGLSYYDNNGVLQTFGRTVVLTPVSTHLCQFSGADTCSEDSVGTLSSLQDLILPVSNRTYHFTFAQNSYAEPLSVSLPTGGQVQWTWDLSAVDDAGQHVTTRTEVPNSGPSGTWSYSTVNGAQVVTDPAGNAVSHLFATIKAGFRDDSIYLQNISAGPSYESTTRYFQGSTTGTLLKTVVTDYDNTGTVIPIRETTTLNDSNQVSKVETSFDTFTAWSGTFTRKDVTERREYAYGTGAPGALVRRTDYSYLHQSNGNYATKNIVDLVTVSSVYDGASSLRSQTTTSYDGTALDSAPGATGHDSSYGTSYLLRGNPTSVSKWLDTTGSNITVATNWYDELGNLTRTQDALSHQTSFSYSDIWGGTGCVPAGVTTYAYRTLTTNALGHRVETHFFPCTGLPERTAEENQLRAGLWTRFTYDSLLRLRRTDFPDGGYTTSDPNDAVPFIVTNKKLLNTSGTLLTTEDERDGLGRPIQAQVLAPECTIKTDTSYDANGRRSTTSNPYCLATEGTYGTTATLYDPLGRVKQITMQDGGIVTTTFSGSCSTVTDEAGKKRKSCSDAQGHLTQVFEDPTDLNYETDYQYDVLDNLTRVDQKGGDPNSADWRTRTFTYDSLSRLLTANNPESGTINYFYTTSGGALCSGDLSSVCRRTDAKGITTTYAYNDALNRLTAKTYSDGITADAAYEYDLSTELGHNLTNPIGHLVKSSSGGGSVARVYSYDVRGRVIQTWESGATTSTINIVYGYNPDDSVASITYPSGRRVDYTYDSAERTISVIDSSTGEKFVSARVFYDATLGKIDNYTSAATATFAGIQQHSEFNKRLQPVVISATAGANQLMNLGYDFGLGTSDNGNVLSVINNLDQSRTQSFTYDGLNRLYMAHDGGTWGNTYQVDPWGNLYQKNPLSGYSIYDSLTKSVNAKNQFTGSGYDLSGNMTSEGGANYTYDAENRLITAGGVTYTYDAEGKRVKKSNGTAYFYGAGSDVLRETNLSAQVLKDYFYLDGKKVAYRDYHPATYYYLSDHLGSTRKMATSAGVVCSDVDYHPWGETGTTYTDTCPQNYKFTGKERDAESGLDYFGARYYASTIGRWMSPDWSAAADPVPYADFNDPQSLNLYGYVRNNPMSHADADGHVAGVDDAVEVAVATVAFVGIVASVYLAQPATQKSLAAAASSAYSSTSEKIRRLWEKVNGQPWPKDPATGKNHDVSHETPKADGGTSEIENIKPRPHAEHVELHKQRGDFKRWGKRAKPPTEEPKPKKPDPADPKAAPEPPKPEPAKPETPKPEQQNN